MSRRKLFHFPRPHVRPQNVCGACGYRWYPRGHNVSAKCPNCGGANVGVRTSGCAGCVSTAALVFGALVAASWVSRACNACDHGPSTTRETPHNAPSSRDVPPAITVDWRELDAGRKR